MAKQGGEGEILDQGNEIPLLSQSDAGRSESRRGTTQEQTTSESWLIRTNNTK